MLQRLRRSKSRPEQLDAAAALCLQQGFEDSGQYAVAIEEACGYRRLWPVALAALVEMRSRRVPRSSNVYVAAIRSCGGLRNVSKGLGKTRFFGGFAWVWAGFCDVLVLLRRFW